MTNNLIIQKSSNSPILSNNQAKDFAFVIVQDIADYIQAHQTEYQLWLKEQAYRGITYDNI